MLDAAAFQQHGRQLAEAFCAGESLGGDDLVALLEKRARDENLNPEQIRRLVEATNRAVFSTKYAASKGTADRRTLFTPVNAEQVLGRLKIAAAPRPIEAAPDQYPDLRELRPRPAQTKTAAEASPEKVLVRRDPWAEYDVLTRLHDELTGRAKQAEYLREVTLRELAGKLKASTLDLEAFEKNAVALFGGTVYEELNDLRDDRGASALPAPRSKYAAAQEVLVGRPDQLSEALGKAAQYRAQYNEAYGMLAELQEDLRPLRQELFGE